MDSEYIDQPTKRGSQWGSLMDFLENADVTDTSTAFKNPATVKIIQKAEAKS